jgi:uncharacterized protein YbaA (DUF1428 family)
MPYVDGFVLAVPTASGFFEGVDAPPPKAKGSARER